MLKNNFISLLVLCSLHCISADLSSLLPNLGSGVVGDVIDRNTMGLNEIKNQVSGLKNLFGFTMNQENVPADVAEIAKMDPEEVAKYWNYDAETHTVTTDDGYILSLHHIWNSSVPPNGQVIYLQHGLLDTSFTWVVNLPHQSLAFILADLGYDVWMGNFRGNTYSRKHESLNPDLPEFWCFTFHELAVHDLPAMIDYVLDKTEAKTISYVGHSQGTTTPLILLSSLPEYNQKLKTVNLFAPIMDLEHCTSPLIYPFVRNQEFLRLLRCTELMKNSEVMRIMAEAACSSKSMTQGVCDTGLNAFMGNSENQLNETRLPIYMAHSPGGSSMGQVSHYAQFVRTGKFCRYDYGILQNEKEYGQATPPCYPVEDISTKVSLYYSDNDSLGDPKDVDVLIKRLTDGDSLDETFYLTNDMAIFNHQDYTWSVNAKDLVYAHLIEVLKKHWDDDESSTKSSSLSSSSGKKSSGFSLFG